MPVVEIGLGEKGNDFCEVCGRVHGFRLFLCWENGGVGGWEMGKSGDWFALPTASPLFSWSILCHAAVCLLGEESGSHAFGGVVLAQDFGYARAGAAA